MRFSRHQEKDFKDQEGLELVEKGKSNITEVSLKCFIDGPYGAPASNLFNASHAVLIATGIGVTPFSSILQVTSKFFGFMNFTVLSL